MKDDRMDNIVECAYNMDNGYVEVWFTDGNMLRMRKTNGRIQVENFISHMVLSQRYSVGNIWMN